MDGPRFDTLARFLTETRSRRGALATLLGGTIGLLGLTDTAAKKRKKGKGKKDKRTCGKAQGASVGGDARECPERCTENDDCPPNNVCRKGECIVGCDSDSDCNPYTICQGGQCVPKPCQSGADCPFGACLSGHCGPGCQGNVDCSVNYRCLNGQCVPVECHVDSDCPPGKHCLSDFTCF